VNQSAILATSPNCPAQRRHAAPAADRLPDRLDRRDAVNHQVIWEPLVGRDAIQEMFEREFRRATMVCQIENLFQDGDWAILEWSDPKGLRGCGFFKVIDDQIVFQRGYSDELSFLRQQGLPLPAK
jgi:hypothetical protein